MRNPNLLERLGIIKAEVIEVTLEDLTGECPEVYGELQDALSKMGIDYCNVSVERVPITGMNLFSGITQLRGNDYTISATSRDNIPEKIGHALWHIPRDEKNPIKDLLNNITEPVEKHTGNAMARVAVSLSA